MSALLLKHASILTMDPDDTLFQDGALLVEDDRISVVGPSSELTSGLKTGVEQIDLRGKWVLPGLINTHVHTSQQLGRGLADDVDLLTWLRERTWPYESNLTSEDSYVSTLLFGLEQIRSGVTCFSESGGQHVDAMGRAVAELGLRGTLARSTMDMSEGLPSNWQETTETALEQQDLLFERWNGKSNDRIRYWFSLRTIFNNSDDLIRRTKDMADSRQTGIAMHVAEIEAENDFALETRGASTVSHLAELGLLGPNLLAAHCVWLTDREIELFVEHNVKVAHCPAAALRVLGFAKIAEMIQAGICVSLGTDGAPCNNRMNLIDEMWLASLIQKGRLQDPTALPVYDCLSMVTRKGAEALGWADEIGSLEAGKKADLVVIDPDSPNMLPLHDPTANMVNAMQSINVESVMVDGRWLMRDREILAVNEKAVYEEAKIRAKEVAQRAGIRLPQRFNLVAG